MGRRRASRQRCSRSPRLPFLYCLRALMTYVVDGSSSTTTTTTTTPDRLRRASGHAVLLFTAER